jgi:putative phosphoribosyl transferase
MKGLERSEPALVWTGKVMLEGHLAIPQKAAAVVIFASAPSLPDDGRDEQIVASLYDAGVATLYVPLLTEDEAQFDSRTAHFRYDADFLAQRFLDLAQWVNRNRETLGLPIAFAGSSGAAAGAIVAAAQRPDLVSAVVSIDGRTDLAVDYLARLRSPVLLVVKDMPVLRMNREALAKIRAERRIEIVHGAECEAVDCVVQKSVYWLEDKFGVLTREVVPA